MLKRPVPEAGLVTQQFAENLLCWKHCGFSIDNSVRPDGSDHKARQALAQYIARAPLSLQKLTCDPAPLVGSSPLASADILWTQPGSTHSHAAAVACPRSKQLLGHFGHARWGPRGPGLARSLLPAYSRQGNRFACHYHLHGRPLRSISHRDPDFGMLDKVVRLD
jgi:hypothetical protein